MQVHLLTTVPNEQIGCEVLFGACGTSAADINALYSGFFLVQEATRRNHYGVDYHHPSVPLEPSQKHTCKRLSGDQQLKGSPKAFVFLF